MREKPIPVKYQRLVSDRESGKIGEPVRQLDECRVRSRMRRQQQKSAVDFLGWLLHRRCDEMALAPAEGAWVVLRREPEACAVME
jgi:hypothetical protein